MKKKLSATLGALTICALLAGLGGCSDSASEAQNGNAIANATEPVTVSKAFNTKSIWFGTIGASTYVNFGDTPVLKVYVFDGKGNVTFYDMEFGENHLEDFDGLSEDKIIELASQKSKESLLARVEETRKEIKSAYCESFDYGYNTPDDFYESTDMTCYEAAQKLDSIEYKEPQPMPFQLTLHTNFNKETLDFTYYGIDLSFFNTFGEYVEKEKNLEISLFYDTDKYFPADTGNTYYSGYYDLLTIVNKKHPGFILDTPETEGVTVEE